MKPLCVVNHYFLKICQFRKKDIKFQNLSALEDKLYSQQTLISTFYINFLRKAAIFKAKLIICAEIKLGHNSYS